MYRLMRLGFAVLCLVSGLWAQQTPPANAAVGNQLLSDNVNAELPKWLRLGGEYRARVEGFTGGGFKRNTEDAYLLSRLRINMYLLPTSWLRFGFQGQDAHVFWKN